MKTSTIDMLTLSGHKIHAPKGIGALYLRRAVRFRPLILAVANNVEGVGEQRMFLESLLLAKLLN